MITRSMIKIFFCKGRFWIILPLCPEPLAAYKLMSGIVFPLPFNFISPSEGSADISASFYDPLKRACPFVPPSIHPSIKEDFKIFRPMYLTSKCLSLTDYHGNQKGDHNSIPGFTTAWAASRRSVPNEGWGFSFLFFFFAIPAVSPLMMLWRELLTLRDNFGRPTMVENRKKTLTK